MQDETHRGGPEDQPADGQASGRQGTGSVEVDGVLADLAALEGRPVAEHVAVFEDAHRRLRRALDPASAGPVAAGPDA